MDDTYNCTYTAWGGDMACPDRHEAFHFAPLAAALNLYTPRGARLKKCHEKEVPKGKCPTIKNGSLKYVESNTCYYVPTGEQDCR